MSTKYGWIILSEFIDGKPILVSIASIVAVLPSHGTSTPASDLILNDGKAPIVIRESAMDVANKLAMVGAVGT